MSTVNALLKLARQAVHMVQSQIQQQMQVLEEQVRNPMQNMVSQVVSGVWVGDGADAFVSEVTSLFIPGAARITDSCNITRTSIDRAMSVVDTADEAVNGLVNELDGIFEAIF